MALALAGRAGGGVADGGGGSRWGSLMAEVAKIVTNNHESPTFLYYPEGSAFRRRDGRTRKQRNNNNNNDNDNDNGRRDDVSLFSGCEDA